MCRTILSLTNTLYRSHSHVTLCYRVLLNPNSVLSVCFYQLFSRSPVCYTSIQTKHCTTFPLRSKSEATSLQHASLWFEDFFSMKFYPFGGGSTWFISTPCINQFTVPTTVQQPLPYSFRKLNQTVKRPGRCKPCGFIGTYFNRKIEKLATDGRNGFSFMVNSGVLKR